MKKFFKVMVVEDDEDDFFILQDLVNDLVEPKVELVWIPTYKEALNASYEHVDVVFIDYRLGAATGIDLIKEFKARGIALPMILLTGQEDRSVDVEAMELGAADYLIKGQITAQILERAIRYAVSWWKVHEELIQKEANQRGLFNATFEGIIVHEDNGLILDANKTAADLFGFTLETLCGLNFQNMLNEGKQLRIFESTAASGSSQFVSYHSAGHKIYIEVSTKPFWYKGRAVKLSAVRDISERKNLEDKLLQNERLSTTGILASGLAHEVGTPLQVVRARAELLGAQPRSPEEIKRGLDIIVSQIDRVSKLIKSLLVFARGEFSQEIESVNLLQCITQISELLAHDMRTKGVAFEIDVDPNIKVQANQENLQQVFINLFVNALHAIGSEIKKGTCKTHAISVKARKLGHFWTIDVKDTGCGISETNLADIFKPFFTTKDVGEGTGLGLAITHRFIEAWGGRIEVESEVSNGTHFHIQLLDGT